jgi:hypothetical protein
MKRSTPLRVIADRHQGAGDIQINPNDGFDLGLMTTHYSVQLELGATPETLGCGKCQAMQGTIYLRNEVSNNTVILNSGTAQALQLSRPLVQLVYYEGKMCIIPADIE